MKFIKFRRLYKKNWEIATSERELFEKLDGDMAEIEMTAKSRLFTKWWMKWREIDKTEAGNPVYETYCPWYAKPLDWIYDLIFGKQTLEKI
jgi:hypothetical protein